MKNQNYLYDLLEEQDIRWSERYWNNILRDGSVWEFDFTCYDAFDRMKIKPGNKCSHATCPLFAQWMEDKNWYVHERIRVDRSVALECPIIFEKLKIRYEKIQKEKKRARWIRKFNKKRA